MHRNAYTSNIFVGNLPCSTTEKDVLDILFPYEIMGVNVKEGKRNDGSKVAFCRLLEEEKIDECIAKLSGRLTDGLSLYIARLPNKSNDTGNQTERDFSTRFSRPAFTSKVTLVGTHVEDPCTFWAQNVADRKVIAKISQELENLGEGALSVEGKPVLGKIYGSFYHQDGNFYRCRPTEHITDETSAVLYLDFGNTDVIPNKQICILTSTLSSYPPMSKRYRFNFIKPISPVDNKINHKKGIKFLMSKITNKLLECVVYKNDLLSYIPVDLVVDDQNVGDEVVFNGFGVRGQKMSFVSPPPSEISVKLTSAESKEKVSSEENKTPRETVENGVVYVEDKEKVTTEKIEREPAPIEREKIKRELAPIEREKIKREVQVIEEKLSIDLESIKTERDKYCRQVNTLHTKIEDMKVNLKKNDFDVQLAECVNKLRKVHDLRRQFPLGKGKIDVVESNSELISEDADRIAPKNIKELSDISMVLESYNALQKNISDSANKDDLHDLLADRDSARIELYHALQQLMSEVKAFSLDGRSSVLNDAKTSLLDIYGSFFKVKLVKNTSPLEALLERYREWKGKSAAAIEKARQETDQLHSSASTALKTVIEDISWESPTSAYGSRSNVASRLESLSAALSVEKKIFSVESDTAFRVIPIILQHLKCEIDQELTYINEMKEIATKNEKLMKEIEPHLHDKPNMDKFAIRNTITRTIRSQLRHKLADLRDLEEDDVERERIEDVKSELAEIRQKLHEIFADTAILEEFDHLITNHYPELKFLYPAVVHEAAFKSIIKDGFELYYFDLRPFGSAKHGLHKTTVLGKDYLIREHVTDVTGSKDIINKATAFASVGCEEVVPISGVLIPENCRQVNIQTPFYVESLAEKDTSSLTREQRCAIIRSVTKGLMALHDKNIVHGSLNPRNILLDSETHPAIAPYNFSLSLIQRIENTKTFINGVSYLAPELRDPTNASNASDAFALGCVCLFVFYPETKFEKTDLGIPNLKVIKVSSISKLVTRLLDPNPKLRPSLNQVYNWNGLRSFPRDITGEGKIVLSEAEQREVAALIGRPMPNSQNGGTSDDDSSLD